MNIREKILIVEDEKSIAHFISTILNSNDYETLLARSGSEAKTMISSHCPDLVILDLGLPDMDGIDVLRELRSWSNLPVVVVSARSHEHDKVQALDLGAELELALIHARIVGELDVLREVAAVLLVYDRIVVIDLRTLIVVGRAGNLAALEDDHRGHLDDGLLVEVLYGERYVDVSGNDAVVQRQNLGSDRQLDVFPVLGHLLEAIATRESQRCGNEHHAQSHQFFHNRVILMFIC